MDEQREDVLKQAKKQFRWYNIGSYGWSTAHHCSLALSIISSALGAFLLKINSVEVPHREDYAAGLAVFASVLTALAASGGFERKWRSNRLSRGFVHGILIDLMAPDADLKTARERLKQICIEHDEVVVGHPRDEGDAPTRNL